MAGQQRKEGIRVHALRTKKYDQNRNTNARENETWCEDDSGISSLRYFVKYDGTSMFACHIRLFASVFRCVRANGKGLLLQIQWSTCDELWLLFYFSLRSYIIIVILKFYFSFLSCLGNYKLTVGQNVFLSKLYKKLCMTLMHISLYVNSCVFLSCTI